MDAFSNSYSVVQFLFQQDHRAILFLIMCLKSIGRSIVTCYSGSLVLYYFEDMDLDELWF